MVVVAIILSCLANYRANTCTGRSADNGALQATTKNRTQHRSAGPANQRALPRPNPALTMIVVIVIVPVVVVVVAPATAAVAYAVVVRAVVSVVLVLLSHCRHHRSGKKKRSRKDGISYLGHSPLDARFPGDAQLFLRNSSAA